jgi:adenylate cyclase
MLWNHRTPGKRVERLEPEAYDKTRAWRAAWFHSKLTVRMNVRRVRLTTGLILLTYLATHFANHALGLISLDAMEWGRHGFLLLWRNALASTALYGSLLVHFSLALWSLYQRRHLRMPLWEMLQLTLGLTIPPLLSVHFVGTRLSHDWFGIEDTYSLLVLTLWHASPWDGVRQSILMTVAWVHGCIGFHFWLRLRSWYRSIAPLLLVCALLFPVLGLLGFSQAGREVSNLIARDPNWIQSVVRQSKLPPRSEREALYRVNDAIIAGFFLILALTLFLRGARHLYGRGSRIRINYPDGREIRVPRGFSVLEASRFGRVPHASVCGGRGRCSTCRVRVLAPADGLPPASAAEEKVLTRVGAPPNVRLACQLRPTANLSVIPLLPAHAAAADGYGQPAYLAGQERTIAVLFADLRTFTTIAEQKLPYDLVFLLNSYFAAVGEAISGAGGIVDKFIGDGVMALFGVDSSAELGCREAIAAAHVMVKEIEVLSRGLAAELPVPLKIGIGIHSGPAVVGRMGYGSSIHLTAIGDTVNVASRLQDLTKEYSCPLIISEQVARHAKLDESALPRHEITVRNRREPLAIFVVEDVAGAAQNSAPNATVKKPAHP